ncbi:MAG: alpha/beta hydrolase [Crocinitomicaceae bacterium]
MHRSGIEEATYKDDSLNIHYYKGGDGPPLLFLHGFGGDAMLSWKKYLKKFSKEYTVIAPDILWFGESSGNVEPNLENQAAAMHKLMDHLEIEKVMVVGQSYGGFITLEMNRQKSKRIDYMVIVNSPGPTFDTAWIDTLLQKQNAERIEDLFVFDDYQGVNRLMSFTYKHPKKLPKKLAQQAFEKYFKPNSEQKRKLLRTLHQNAPKMIEFHKYRTFPSFVIWSDSDEIFPVSEGKRLADFLNAYFVVFKNIGHISILQKKNKGIRYLKKIIFAHARHSFSED